MHHETHYASTLCSFIRSPLYYEGGKKKEGKNTWLAKRLLEGGCSQQQTAHKSANERCKLRLRRSQKMRRKSMGIDSTDGAAQCSTFEIYLPHITAGIFSRKSTSARVSSNFLIFHKKVHLNIQFNLHITSCEILEH